MLLQRRYDAYVAFEQQNRRNLSFQRFRDW